MVRTCPITITGAAAGVSAILAGKPNSSIAPRALNIGHMPPKVIVEAMLWESCVESAIVPKSLKRTQESRTQIETGIYEQEARDVAECKTVKHCRRRNV